MRTEFRRPDIAAALVLTAIASAISPEVSRCQQGSLAAEQRAMVKDTVVIAGDQYDASKTKRRWLGANYRDLWTTPIRVPFLDLRTLGGGVRPTKVGGGKQTRSLRLETSTGLEFVFRPVEKELMVLDEEYRGTVIWDAFEDSYSAAHPAAPVVAAPFLEAAGVIHPTPRLVVMPNDTLLGEFREEFAGKLGTVEEFPSVPEAGPGFAGAMEIIDSDSLLKLINNNAREQVDAAALLTARLVDFLLNDNDRHPGQWKWARLQPGGPWSPIPRDRDKALVSYEGRAFDIVRRVKPNLVTFEASYPNPAALFANAIDFDGRLLSGLDRHVWDSVAARLRTAISDSVIDAALSGLPREYEVKSAEIRTKLRARRDNLPAAAVTYYRLLSEAVDLHATDAGEHATIDRLTDGKVEVRIQSGTAAPHFKRRFDVRETSEIRLYLHGGDDSALIRGNVRRSIEVRVIGGSGLNTIMDSSAVGGRNRPTRVYDFGSSAAAKSTRDTVPEGAINPIRRSPNGRDS